MLTDTQMLQAMHFRSSVALQVTLDQDYNVPDNKSDIEKVIVENGRIQIQNIKTMPDKMIFKRQSVLENGLFKRSPELYTGSYGR